MARYAHEDKSLLHLLWAYVISITGSVLAIGLAFTVMFLPWVDVQLLVLSPFVQQIAKPAGVLWVMEKRPLWFHRRWHVVIACLLAGAAFGLLESAAWVLYKHMENYWHAHFTGLRCGVNIAMHVLASAVMSVGLAMAYRPGYKHGLVEYRKLLPFYAAAIAIHLATAGVMRYLAVLRMVAVENI